MTLPNRSKQIEAMMQLLDSEKWDDLSLRELATKVVDDFNAYLGLQEAAPPVHVGFAYKHPSATGTFFVAWVNDLLAWIVDEKTHYGYFVSLDDPYWKFVEESPDRRRKKEGPRPGEPGVNEDGIRPGDKFSLSQRRFKATVLAVGLKCVLMRDENGGLHTDSNGNIARYYRKEVDHAPVADMQGW